MNPLKLFKGSKSTSEILKTKIHGIDVSAYQPNVDWSKVKETQDFVYLKATEGVDFRDRKAMSHGLGCEKVGIPFGYYHFATPSHDDAVAEANDFVKALNELPKWNLIPVLDLEQNNRGMSRAAMEQWCKDFSEVIENELGCVVMLYGSPGLLDSYLPPNNNLGHMPLWVAHYQRGITEPRLPKGWDKFDIWQYADKGHPVEGVGPNVDVNWSTAEFLVKHTVR